jgi:hypothetical protein
MNKQVTLAEIEFYGRKAARALQLDWGICEEAGKAARWLAAFDLPGPELLLGYFAQINNKNYADFIPECNQSPWQSPAHIMCPVIAGAALADRSAMMLEGTQFELLHVAYPLLLVATVGQAARCRKTVFTVRWSEVSVSCFESGISVDGNRDNLFLDRVDSMICHQNEGASPRQLPLTTAYSVDDEIWQQIDALAFQTYAPATEGSRAGAGAGLTDND